MYRELLERLKSRMPEVRAVVFCDHEGEAIEFVSDFDSYQTQLFGAYQSEIMWNVKSCVAQQRVGEFEGLELRTLSGSVALWPIGKQYYLAVMSKGLLSSRHPAVRELRRALEAEV